MPHTIIAFGESIDEAGVEEELVPISDPTISEEGDYVYVPELNMVVGLIALLGSTGVSGYIDTPSLRRISVVHLSPITKQIYPTNYERMNIFPKLPLALVPLEGLKVISVANPSAAEFHTIGLMLADGAIEPVVGEIFRVKATAAITITVGEWKHGELTFADKLSEGTYAIVGVRVEAGTGGSFFRLIPIGAGFRPGGICVADVESKDPPFHRNGELGTWLEFTPRTAPSLEIVGNATSGTSQVVHLDIIKLS